MKKSRILSVFLTACLLVSLVPAMEREASAAHTHVENDPGSSCGVCMMAGMINALPNAEDITEENAAMVLDRLHAIDRIKFDVLSDDEAYEALMELVEIVSDPLNGFPLPKRFYEARDKIVSLDADTSGGWVSVTKPIFDMQGQPIDSLDFQSSNAQFTIERLDGGGSVIQSLGTVTLSGDTTFASSPSYLSGTDYAAVDRVLMDNGVQTGWTYRYHLPVGRYRITESDSRTMTFDGDELTTTPCYSTNGGASYIKGDSVIFSIEHDGDTASVDFMNTWTNTLTIRLSGDIPAEALFRLVVTNISDPSVVETITLTPANFTEDNGEYVYEYTVNGTAVSYTFVLGNRSELEAIYEIEGSDASGTIELANAIDPITFSFTQTVFPDPETPSDPMRGNVYGQYVAGGTIDVISVDIEWNSMRFAYSSEAVQIWIPEEHDYSGEPATGWTPLDKNGDLITITNHSNVDVEITPSAAPTKNTVTGINFAVEETGIDYATDYVLQAGIENEYENADYLMLAVVPQGSLSESDTTLDKIAGITITIEKYEAP